jgi:hypothetical protein
MSVTGITTGMENISLKDSQPLGSKPEAFFGNRAGLEYFILQMDTYIMANNDKYKTSKEKILLVLTHLKGPALNWIKVPLKNFLSGYSENWDARTKELFGYTNDEGKYYFSYDKLKEGLEKAFGDMNETRKAERALHALKQYKSVQSYTQVFQDITSSLEWDDEPLMDVYYRGLKDRVKDDIAKGERPNTLEGLILMATRIDDRHYERFLEKKGQGGWHPSFRKNHYKDKRPYAPPQQPRSNFQSYGRTQYFDPMEIDATKRHPFKRGPPRRQGTKCFNCNKNGHMARNCRAPKREQRPFKRNNNFATDRRETRNISATIVSEIKIGNEGTPSHNSLDEEPISINKDQEDLGSNSSFEIIETEKEEATKEVHVVQGHDELLKLIKKMEDEYEEKKEPQKQDSDTQTGENSPGQPDTNLPEESKEEYEHGKLHFSACYDDYCNIHLQEKEGSGWFPSIPHRKGKKNCKCDKCLEKAYELRRTCGIPLDDFEWEMCHDPKCDYHREGEHLYPWNTFQHIRLLATECQLPICDYHDQCRRNECNKFHPHPRTTKPPRLYREDATVGTKKQGKDQLSH